MNVTTVGSDYYYSTPIFYIFSGQPQAAWVRFIKLMPPVGGGTANTAAVVESTFWFNPVSRIWEDCDENQNHRGCIGLDPGRVESGRARRPRTPGFTGPATTLVVLPQRRMPHGGHGNDHLGRQPGVQGTLLPSRGDNNLRGGDAGTMPDPTTGTAPIGGALHQQLQRERLILSNFNFPLSASGLAVSFTTVTYGGDSGGGGKDGADGISFFLQDATAAPDVGTFGGSLSYTCSNANNDSTLRPSGVNRGYDGLEGGCYRARHRRVRQLLEPGRHASSGWGLRAAAHRHARSGQHDLNWLNTNYPVHIRPPDECPKSAPSASLQTGFVWDWSQVAATGRELPLRIRRPRLDKLQHQCFFGIARHTADCCRGARRRFEAGRRSLIT
jgi:hypothetical protein